MWKYLHDQMYICTSQTIPPSCAPFLPWHWEDQVSGCAEPLQTKQNQQGCFTAQILSWLPSLLAQNTFAAIMWLTALIARVFCSFFFKKKLKCIASIRCSRTFVACCINAYISGVIKIPNFWLPENYILGCIKSSLGSRSREVILFLWCPTWSPDLEAPT